eukprot:Skav223587  [mRNA]  locus=scaffold689:218970:238492:+ [translate_table: standard]
MLRGLVIHGLVIAPVLAVEGSSRSASIIRHGAERLVATLTSQGSREAPHEPQVVREVDSFGRCVIPMWNVRDFACEEHLQVESVNMFEDIKGRLRKKMDDGQTCTIRCPDARWWQVPWRSEMTCNRGIFKYDGDGAVAKKVECYTSLTFRSSIVLVITVVLLSFCIAIHCLRRKSVSTSTPSVPSGGEAQAVPIVRRQAPPAEAAGGTGG